MRGCVATCSGGCGDCIAGPTSGAGDGVRTRDIQLGRLTLCQLSYSRSRHRDGAGDNLTRRRGETAKRAREPQFTHEFRATCACPHSRTDRDDVANAAPARAAVIAAQTSRRPRTNAQRVARKRRSDVPPSRSRRPPFAPATDAHDAPREANRGRAREAIRTPRDTPERGWGVLRDHWGTRWSLLYPARRSHWRR
jgi:hypothetical protein